MNYEKLFGWYITLYASNLYRQIQDGRSEMLLFEIYVAICFSLLLTLGFIILVFAILCISTVSDFMYLAHICSDSYQFNVVLTNFVSVFP